MLKISKDKSYPFIHLNISYSIVEISTKSKIHEYQLILWRAPLCELCTFKVKIA